MIPPASRRWLTARVSMFFIAALVWLMGVAVDSETIRWVAIGLTFIALMMGIAVRITASREEASETDV